MEVFNTVIGFISCIVGIIALIVGGAAYKNCKIIKNKQTMNKTNKNTQDNSQNANVINNGISEQGLTEILSNISGTYMQNNLETEKFQNNMTKAFELFKQETNKNMKSIIEESAKYISDNKLQIAKYTKIDWINIYFENAKNTKDVYMQKIWAKVLAIELATPNTFSIKTLDILKNMTINEFVLFEKLANLQILGFLFISLTRNNCDLSWSNYLILKEYGLLSLNESTSGIKVDAKATLSIIMSKYQIIIHNNTNSNVLINIPCYILTSSACELLKLVDNNYSKGFVDYTYIEIKKYLPKGFYIEIKENVEE